MDSATVVLLLKQDLRPVCCPHPDASHRQDAEQIDREGQSADSEEQQDARRRAERAWHDRGVAKTSRCGDPSGGTPQQSGDRRRFAS